MPDNGLCEAKPPGTASPDAQTPVAAPPLRLRQWIKRQEHPLARALYRTNKRLRALDVPVIRPVHAPLYYLFVAFSRAFAGLLSVLWWTPLFKARLAGPAPGLVLYGGGLPFVAGPLVIRIGRGCRVSTQTSFLGRSAGVAIPALTVGDNVDIGWQTTIAVGRRVVLGNDVRIAGRAFLAGYPGHPLDPVARARGLPDTPDQVGDVVLEDGVWLATGVTVSAGVTIGRGTVIAAGSVVTRNLPPGVLAGGVPARVIRAVPMNTQS